MHLPGIDDAEVRRAILRQVPFVPRPGVLLAALVVANGVAAALFEMTRSQLPVSGGPLARLAFHYALTLMASLIVYRSQRPDRARALSHVLESQERCTACGYQLVQVDWDAGRCSECGSEINYAKNGRRGWYNLLGRAESSKPGLG